MSSPKKSPASARSAAARAEAPASATVDVEPLVDIVKRHVAMRPQVVRELRKDLRQLLEQAAKPAQATVVPEGDEVLTTQQAADMAGVSRPFMAARIDAGDVPLFQQVGNQRRVLASSVRAWHEGSRDRRRQAMAELAGAIEDEYPDEG